MRNLLALIGAAVVLFGVAGWYLGWYRLALTAGTDGKVHINGDVDTHKIVDDSKKFGEKIGQAVEGVKDAKPETTQPAEFVGPPPPPDTPARPTTPPPVTAPTSRTGRN